MPRAFDRQEESLRRDQLPGGLDLVNRSEGIARAMHEHDRYFNVGEVLRSRLLGPAGSVQWVRQQKQTICKFLLCEHHACLAAAIARSEERRVGKECRSRWSPYH